jgi:phage terminase small subunit
MNDRLNQRELAFVYNRARGKNLKESVYAAGYKAKSDNIASSYGVQLEAKLKIQKAIEKERLNIFNKECITTEYVLERLKEVADSGKVEANKIRALELLGKYLALFKSDIKSEDTEQRVLNIIKLYGKPLNNNGLEEKPNIT